MAVPFHRATDPVVNFEPVTFMTNAPLPASLLDGEIEFTMGRVLVVDPPPFCALPI
jgi:hypothetical protein